MLKPSLPESLLGLFAGRDRAAAIYGDLTEMAAARGRLWFAAAYVRTLVSFTWRVVVALFVADIARQFVFDLFHLYMRHTPAVWRNATGSFVDLLNLSGPLLACIMSTLWFALPFAAVRYGRRDPFVRLTAVVAAGTTVAFLAIPWISLIAATATLALVCAAFLSSRWRKPVEVLAWTGAAGLLSLAAFTVLSRRFLAQHPAIAHGLGSHWLALDAIVFSFQGSLLLVAIVCSRVHRWLLERPSAEWVLNTAAGEEARRFMATWWSWRRRAGERGSGARMRGR